MTKDPIQAWLNAAGRFPLLPRSEMTRLATKRDTLEPGSKAYIKVINKICEHNLRLVPNIVRKYLNKRIGLHMSSEVTSDLLQQGYLGLRRAAEKFEAKRGFQFSTYAHSWIYQSVTRWHNSNGRTVYLPENAITEVLYIKRHGERSKSRNGRLGEDYINAAMRAMEISSIDCRANGDDDASTIAELMGEDNRIIDPNPNDEDRGQLMLRDLMAECGIGPHSQDVVLAYAKRGRMSIVASKLSLSVKCCQSLYKEAVHEMKAAVKLKKEAQAKLLVDRMKNNTTSARN